LSGQYIFEGIISYHKYLLKIYYRQLLKVCATAYMHELYVSVYVCSCVRHVNRCMCNTIAKEDGIKSNTERNRNGNWKETLSL
jgi:hypothetical protein